MSARYCPNCGEEIEVDRTQVVKLCRRCQREADTIIRETIQERPRETVPSPSIGVHVAGPVDDVTQRCTRCGNVLKVYWSTHQPKNLPGGAFYPEGALVERGDGWQAMKLSGEPNCETAPF